MIMSRFKPQYWLGLILFIYVLTIASVQAAPPTVLLPVDKAAQQADFLKFRTQLKGIIAKKDVKALLAIVNKNIHISFGEDNGIEAFKKTWHLSNPKTSALWKELSTVLNLGGNFTDKKTFVAPYVFSEWPEALDAFEYIAIIGKDVRIRAAPNLTSAVLAKVSYALLPQIINNNPPPKGWERVKLADGKMGYVTAQYARSSVDYRAFFEKLNGQWQMTAFIAGD